jgi:hypothetical protein
MNQLIDILRINSHAGFFEINQDRTIKLVLDDLRHLAKHLLQSLGLYQTAADYDEVISSVR